MVELDVLYRGNPLRSPDWVWQAAKMFFDRQQPILRSWGGPYIGSVRRFLEDLARATTANHLFCLSQQYPALYLAWKVYTLRTGTSFRWELEARLLTGQPHAEIAQLANLPEETIKIFAAVFFDVADRLTSPSFIVHEVIRPHRKLPPADYEAQVIWKSLAYTYGDVMVDCLVYQTPSRPGRSKLSAADRPQALFRDLQNQLERQTVLALRSPHAAPSATAQIITNYFASVRAAKHAGVENSELDDFKAGLQQVLENLPWERDAAQAQRRGQISPLEQQHPGVSLRADELLRESAGGDLAALKAMLPSCKYPPRCTKTTVSS
jgi:hypothetical protein